MKELGFTLLALVGLYLVAVAALYLFQRKLIYYPTAPDDPFVADEIRIDSQGLWLRGWVLNPGKPAAVIYFGGNSESITWRRDFFEDALREFSVYLVNYRGYGRSEGQPDEAGLFADALAVYDHIAPLHQRILAYGRSLGSGIAVYLATQRRLERMILLTPYDSIVEVAQGAYPMFPVRFLLKDRFDSAARAAAIELPVLIASAELDRVIPLPRTLELKRRMIRARLEYRMIEGAAHDDIIDFPEYREIVRRFATTS